MSTLTEPQAPSVAWHQAWRDPVVFLALGLGSGCSPRAPGTAGTLLAVPLCWLAQTYLSALAYALLTIALFSVGIALCGAAAERLNVPDHPSIVWDEICGFFITMTAAPPGWMWLAVGFVLFRLFDICKPWPIRQIEQHVPGGFGIMGDDVMAAAYAWLVLQLCVLVWSAMV